MLMVVHLRTTNPYWYVVGDEQTSTGSCSARYLLQRWRLIIAQVTNILPKFGKQTLYGMKL